MNFKGNYPIRLKTVLEHKILEQILNFKYLRCNINFRDDIDVQ
jgi:hypothetical protein